MLPKSLMFYTKVLFSVGLKYFGHLFSGCKNLLNNNDFISIVLNIWDLELFLSILKYLCSGSKHILSSSLWTSTPLSTKDWWLHNAQAIFPSTFNPFRSFKHSKNIFTKLRMVLFFSSFSYKESLSDGNSS